MKHQHFVIILIVFCFLIHGTTSCDSVIKKIRDKKTTESEIISNPSVQEKIGIRVDQINDSIKKSLIDNYHSAYNLDSLQFAFTIVFQESLKKSDNLLYISEAFLRDIEQNDNKTYLILSTFFPRTLLKLEIDAFQCEQIYKKYLEDRFLNQLCIVLNVFELQSIRTEVTVSESSKDPQFYLNVGSEQMYYIKGELLSYNFLMR